MKAKVLALVQQIPKGKVTTYGEIARKLGNKSLARAVGNALKKNEFLIVIPCHRVVNTNGFIGGYVAGVDKKLQLLLNEGIKVVDNKVVNLTNCLFRFNH